MNRFDVIIPPIKQVKISVNYEWIIKELTNRLPFNASFDEVVSMLRILKKEQE